MPSRPISTAKETLGYRKAGTMNRCPMCANFEMGKCKLIGEFISKTWTCDYFEFHQANADILLNREAKRLARRRARGPLGIG